MLMFLRPTLGVAIAIAIATSPLAHNALGAQQPTSTTARPAAAPRPLSLDEAMRIAEHESENVQIARAGLDRARGQQLQARSQYMPQLSGSLQYTRTLKSQFSALKSSQPTPGPDVPPAPERDTTTFFQPCTRYLAPAGATQAERLTALETFSR